MNGRRQHARRMRRKNGGDGVFSTLLHQVLGKAVEAFDNLGSSVANRAGPTFAAGVVPKGNKIGILAFEVANTIVKGSNLKQSLSEEEMKILTEETLGSEGVQLLVSTDYKELMSIAAADKRHELKVFTDEVVRFGNHCRDPQWHNLDRVFSRLIKDGAVPHQSKEEANRVMNDLMVLAQNTAELYHELHSLDRFRIDLKRKQQEEEFYSGNVARGAAIPEETVSLLKSEVKSQERHVKTLKRRSLWAKILEEVMEQLVDIVYYLYQEINENFGPDVFLEEAENGCTRKTGKLGTSGLALHYANIINQIDTLVTRPSSVPPNARDNLYQGLPPTMKAALRIRLQQNSNLDQMTIDELKSELYKILDWMVPVASNTTKAHHGFGWVGEWANTGSAADRKAMGYTEITLLQTLHHANQQKVEAYILELIVGLHHLVSRARKNMNKNSNVQLLPQKPPNKTQDKKPVELGRRKLVEPFVPPERNISPPPFEMFASVSLSNSPSFSNGFPNLPHHAPVTSSSSKLSQEDESTLSHVDSGSSSSPIFTPGLGMSEEFDSSVVLAEREQPKLSQNSSHSSSTAKKFELDQTIHKPRNSKVDPLRDDVHRVNEHSV
ncbi:protein PSK SIMULATOR 1 isoform X3 [Physcomitrium patens]|uniref:protein PSK SIMULATOR 1 isoform X3 n=1 Tax=Physcomitrium patens TaxID=3218 RepID=UPI00024B06F7|nr:uncharacterized protein LOC112291383 isoform X3 [Physcomitrium patens]|eukprot:XP_024394485.1 uncharacterized protein LOC112291383 isoform X3 [Physcomitrella patens]